MAFFAFLRLFFVFSHGGFRYFVFLPGLISSFLFFHAWRLFVISSFRMFFSSYRCAITPGEKMKKRNNESEQVSHYAYSTVAKESTGAYDSKLALRIHEREVYMHVQIRTSSRENLSSVVCEQHRRRPAFASAQSDQRLYYSLFGKILC